MKIIFAGTPQFAEHHLQALIDSDHQICAVYTQPDRPAGRGKKLMASPVKQTAERCKIPVYQPQTLKSEEAQTEFQALEADLMVVVAYGLILPKPVLDAPQFGCINVHASILPRWRGAAPIQRAIQAGDQQSGVTIMQMDEGLDTGDMLLKTYCEIEDDDNSATLHDKLGALGPAALLEVIAKLADGGLEPVSQNDSDANYAAKIDKKEARINWLLSAQEIDRNIRAFNPFPVCFSELAGERIKIHSARPAILNTQIKPGFFVIENSKIFVGCGEGALEIERIQAPGKKAMLVADYLNGLGHKLAAKSFT